MRPIRLQALQPTADPTWVLDQQGFRPLHDSSIEPRFLISRTIDRPPGTVVAPRTYVDGLFDIASADQPMVALVPAPDWFRINISLSPRNSGCTDYDVTAHRQTLDFRRGALVTEMCVARPPDLMVRAHVMRLVSLHSRALGLQVIQLDVDAGTAEITLEASFDGLQAGLVAERLELGLGVWHTRTTGKRLAMAAAASLLVDGQMVAVKPLGPLHWSWTWTMRPGQIVHFERIVAVALSDATAFDPVKHAQGQLAAAKALGWAELLAEHEASWADRWCASNIVIDGDPASQHALRFALYHLNGAANPHDASVAIAAHGPAGADCHGHVFQDSEIFLLPFYTLTWPEAARALLIERFNTLGGARAKAQRMGLRGAMYAWESAGTGAETCPKRAIGPDRQIADVLCGTQELHISAEVAYAVWHYWQATGDDGFLRDAGAEILLETARFWSSRAQPEADGQHHIRSVIGADDYHETIDDNAFTNVMARWNIRRGIAVAALLRQRWPARWATLSRAISLHDAELRQWADIADTLATGLDPQTGLFERFEGFFKLEPIDLGRTAGWSVPMDVVLGQARSQTAQIIKQADVVALLALLPDEFAAGAAAANFSYYEPRCSQGSSLSAALHGVAAARLGQTELAMRFFRQTSATDPADPPAAIDGGVRIAALGGLWMIAVLGFAGLAWDATGLRFNPQLPAEWRGLAFSVQWQGRQVSISIDGADRTLAATLICGQPMTIALGDRQHPLSMQAPLVVGLPSQAG